MEKRKALNPARRLYCIPSSVRANGGLPKFVSEKARVLLFLNNFVSVVGFFLKS